MNNKQKENQHTYGNKKKYIIGLAIFTLSAFLTASVLYVLNLGSDTAITQTESSSTAIKIPDTQSKYAYVNEIEEKRYISPNIITAENKLDIPEERAHLPLNQDSKDIKYQYWKHELWLSVPAAIGRQNDEDVPSCDKVVIVSLAEKPYNDHTFVDTVTALDGSPRYIYKHKACTTYDDELSSRVADVARQIQYY